MSTSWRCWRVWAWNSRRVESSLMDTQMPSPCQASWRTWLSLRGWASNDFCNSNNTKNLNRTEMIEDRLKTMWSLQSLLQDSVNCKNCLKMKQVKQRLICIKCQWPKECSKHLFSGFFQIILCTYCDRKPNKKVQFQKYNLKPLW